MNFRKLKETYILKKNNKSGNEIKNFYNDLNLIWTNCFIYNEDNSLISYEAKRLRKLANKLIKDRIMTIGKENPIKIETGVSEENQAFKSKNPSLSGRSNSVAKEVGKKKEDIKVYENKNKKDKFQTLINLNTVVVVNDSNKATRGKINTTKNLKSLDFEERFKAPSVKNSKATTGNNKAKSIQEAKNNDNTNNSNQKDRNEFDTRSKSTYKKPSSMEIKNIIKNINKKIITDDSYEFFAEKNDYKLKCEDEFKEAGSSSCKNIRTIKYCASSSDAVMDLEKNNKTLNSTEEQQSTEKATPDENIPSEQKVVEDNLKIAEEGSKEAKTTQSASSNHKEEISEAKNTQNSIIETTKNIQNSRNLEDNYTTIAITQADDKMDIDHQQVARESIKLQNPIEEEFKNFETFGDNDKNKNANINEITAQLNATEEIKEETQGNNNEAESESKSESNIKEVAKNEVEVVFEKEVIKVPYPQNNQKQKNNKIQNNIPENISENTFENKDFINKKIQKTSNAIKYGYDLVDDLRRFNNRVCKEGSHEITQGEIYTQTFKRSRKQVDYKTNESVKLQKRQKTDENQNKNLSLNLQKEEKDKSAYDYKNNNKNDNKNRNINFNIEKKGSASDVFNANAKNKKSFNISQKSFNSGGPVKKVNNDTIDLNEDDDSHEAEFTNKHNKNKKKSKTLAKRFKYDDKEEDKEEDLENESLNDLKAKKTAKPNKNNKEKQINLSLMEEAEKTKEKDADSHSDSEADIK